MHMYIGVITYGKNKQIAREAAKDIVNNMCDETGYAFDGNSVMGKTVSVKGDIGRKLISRCMRATIREFLYALKKVRTALDRYTDKQLASSERIYPEEGGDMVESTGMARYWMYRAGSYKGSAIYLYDSDGEGIRTREHLKNVLNQWDKPTNGFKVYVTPFDVHY